jgi:hypothetical protein
VLLRELPQVAAVANREAPLTPSQVRALIQAGKPVKLEVVVLGPDSKWVESIQFTIAAPDGETHEGDLGTSGRARIASDKKGTARVSLAWPETTP